MLDSSDWTTWRDPAGMDRILDAIGEELERLVRKRKMGTYDPAVDGTLDDILERLEAMLRD